MSPNVRRKTLPRTRARRNGPRRVDERVARMPLEIPTKAGRADEIKLVATKRRNRETYTSSVFRASELLVTFRPLDPLDVPTKGRSLEYRCGVDGVERTVSSSRYKWQYLLDIESFDRVACPPIQTMWPILARALSRFNVYICIPLGVIGYYIEGLVSNRYTPPTVPVTEQREERLLKDMDAVSDKKAHRPLEVNLPPSLST